MPVPSNTGLVVVGTIKELALDWDGFKVRLDTTHDVPSGYGFFYVKKVDNSNYNDFFAMAMLAFAHNKQLIIRTAANANSSQNEYGADNAVKWIGLGEWSGS